MPTGSLLKRGYKDLIQVRIFGPGRVPRTTIPEDGSLLEIEPRVGLGSILEFSQSGAARTLKSVIMMQKGHSTGSLDRFTILKKREKSVIM